MGVRKTWVHSSPQIKTLRIQVFRRGCKLVLIAAGCRCLRHPAVFFVKGATRGGLHPDLLLFVANINRDFPPKISTCVPIISVQFYR